ncbi:putative peptidase domain-containing protein [Trichophaea hybrida]|nr:putative peptidase domain-containing protein [Trichophaea hybrida]
MYTASVITAILAVCASAFPSLSSNGEQTPLPSGTAVIGPLGVTVAPTCNSTQKRQIISGLSDAAELSSVARSYLLETGNFSPIFTKYFGANASSAAVIGVYDRILWANKEGVLFRCDDVDGKCAANTTWAGHHRTTAPLETVICDPSFEKRLYLQQMCSRGYTVSKSPLNLFWASDLLHRLFHVPMISEKRIKHIAGADGYDGSLELATAGDQRTVENSDSLQYFALEVFAERVAEPGVGCL